MPFKRRLRLAFAALDHPHWCDDAVEVARAVAAASIEAAVFDAVRGAAWPDLVVLLDRDRPADIEALPAGVQARACDLRGCADEVARHAALHARIEGIAGGLKLLGRQG